jgi:nucleoside-diphosphate-sugar epimerase
MEFIEGDIRDRQLMANAIKGVDFIVHLAAIVGAPACKKDERSAWEINHDATALLNDLRGGIPVVFPSTTSGYGTRTKIEGLCTEDTEQNPISLYGDSKCRAEKILLSGGNAVSYRFATGFGLSPRLRLDLMPNDFVFKAVKKRYLVVFEKHFKRAFIHVTDMARSFIFAVENFDRVKDNAYNVGTEEMNYTKEELCRKIAGKVGCALFFSDEDFDPDKRDYLISFSKIKDKGFRLEVDMDTALNELIKGFKALRYNVPFANVEYYG